VADGAYDLFLCYSFIFYALSCALILFSFWDFVASSLGYSVNPMQHMLTVFPLGTCLVKYYSKLGEVFLLEKCLTGSGKSYWLPIFHVFFNCYLEGFFIFVGGIFRYSNYINLT